MVYIDSPYTGSEAGYNSYWNLDDDDTDSEFLIDSDGDWITNNYIKPFGLIIPKYTPTSTLDTKGEEGEMVRDDNFLYLKTSGGWKRSSLETF